MIILFFKKFDLEILRFLRILFKLISLVISLSYALLRMTGKYRDFFQLGNGDFFPFLLHDFLHVVSRINERESFELHLIHGF